MPKLYRGRLIDHIQIISRDLAASRRFYESIFSVLKIPIGGSGKEYFWADELFVSSTAYDADSVDPTGPIHLAFQAEDHTMVNQFYKIGLESGGMDDGKPGERKYHPGYYAAFLLDPDGNYIEAVYHGPAKQSAPAIEIDWQES
jgi:catechol 2,3-dioxygenase-like lactoylglutathione lyase family enzyme